MHKGWYQIAFERELRDPLTLVRIGELPLVVVRRPHSVRVFAAVCPHRGANLADGRLQDDQIICPFHGYAIGLGESCPGELKVPEYPSLSLGGMIFVLLSAQHDNEFAQVLWELDRSHYSCQASRWRPACRRNWSLRMLSIAVIFRRSTNLAKISA